MWGSTPFALFPPTPACMSSSSPVESSQPVRRELLCPSSDTCLVQPPDVILPLITRYVNAVGRGSVFRSRRRTQVVLVLSQTCGAHRLPCFNVDPMLGPLHTGRRNQTICGCRRNADVGVAALSSYAALRQHGMLHSVCSLHIWRWVQYNGMTPRWWSAWRLLVLGLEPYCTRMVVGCNRHKRVRLSTLVDRTL